MFTGTSAKFALILDCWFPLVLLDQMLDQFSVNRV